MIIETMNTHEVSSKLIKTLNEIAATGFNQPPNDAMMNDTKQHIQSAEHIQIAYTSPQEAIGFALYRRCLWPAGN